MIDLPQPADCDLGSNSPASPLLRSCLVCVSGRDPQRQKTRNSAFFQTHTGFTRLTASGTIIDACLVPDLQAQRPKNTLFILTSGELVKPFCDQQQQGIQSQWQSSPDQLNLSDEPPRMLADTQCEVVFESNAQASSNNDPSVEFTSHKATVERLSSVAGVDAAMQRLQADSHHWAVGWTQPKSKQNSTQNNSQQQSAGLLALLSLQVSFDSPLLHLTPLRVGCSCHLRRGASLQITSSPYGLLSPRVFHNSVSQGCISNIVASPEQHHTNSPDQNDLNCASVPLFLTDARTLPGAEGGTVRLLAEASDAQDSTLWIGCVTLPLRQTHELHSPVQFSFIISAQAIVEWLQPKSNASFNPSKVELSHANSPLHQLASQSVTASRFGRPLRTAPTLSTTGRLQHLQSLPTILSDCTRCVLMLRCGDSWASGIVLTTQGHIVTNRHLIAPFLNADSSMRQPVYAALRRPPIDSSAACASESLVWLPCCVRWVCKGAFDVALLQLSAPIPFALHPARLCAQSDVIRLRRCHSIAVCGFPLFSPGAQLQSTVTFGQLSRLVCGRFASLARQPLLIQTSACVHNGNSGGALFSSRTGQVIGLVTSNVIHNSQVDPHQFEVQHPQERLEQDNETPQHWSVESNKHWNSWQHNENSFEHQVEPLHHHRVPESPPPPLQPELSTILPNLNFTLPTNCLHPIRAFALSQCKDFSLLAALDTAAPHVEQLWQLDEPQQPMRTRQRPLSPRYYAAVRQLEKDQQKAAVTQQRSSL